MFSAIGGFLSGAFDTVTNWVTGSSGGAVQAVAGQALKGAAYGTVIGGAQAAITGGDIKSGALEGAAAGGIATGIAGSLIQMSGAKGTIDTGAASQNTLQENMGTPVETSLAETASGMEQVKTATPVVDKFTKEKSWWEKIGLEGEEKGKVIGGILQGAATGAGNYFTAKQQAEATEDLQEREYQIEREKIAANQPSAGFKQKSVLWGK